LSFIKLVLTVAALSVTMLVAGLVASASPAGGSRCTLGEARSNFEAPFEQFLADDPADWFRCQYRFFFDGDTFTYCEDDVILGGINLFSNYRDLGWSRAEAIADLERIGTRAWVDGIEQQLMRTAYKDGENLFSGAMVVYQHRAFITQLPVGDHVSYYEESFDGIVVFTSTIQLHILPRTDAACS
jgi:hypothetical protein